MATRNHTPSQIPCVCLICQSTFYRYPSEILHGSGNYCSIECGKQRPRREVSCVCLGCQTTFIVKLSAVQRGEGRYCSRACFQQHRPLIPATDRFWSHVEKTDECWIWTGRVNNQGYGQLSIPGGKRYILAHRFSYELVHGAIMPTVFCLHRCDRPTCVNPAHLWLGSQTDNIRDMIDKGRSRAQRYPVQDHPERYARGERNGTHTHPEKVVRGEQSGMAKLTDAIVREIRQMHTSKQWTRKQIGARFGVGKSTIDKVLARQVWKHVD